jgi:uncharacterized protein (DUF3820 family)
MKKIKQNDLIRHNRTETDPRYRRMPYGKYRGFFMKDVPVAYLKWCVMTFTDLAMATFLKDELIRREPKLKKPIKI